MKRVHSVIFVLTVIIASLGLARQSQAAPIQSSMSWQDQFGDNLGLHSLSDTEVAAGSGALTLAHAISNPSLYKSSGEAVSEIVNPSVKTIPTPQLFRTVTDGKNGYLYLSSQGDLYSYRLETGEFAQTSISFAGQHITSMTTAPDGKIFMGVSTLVDSMNCPENCLYGTGKIWSYDPATGDLEDHGVPLIDTALTTALVPGPSRFNLWNCQYLVHLGKSDVSFILFFQRVRSFYRSWGHFPVPEYV